jgi:hypothetical protein
MTAAAIVGAVSGLVLFGVLVGALDSFWIARAVVALQVSPICPLYARLPETLGLELEESAPD